MPAIYIKPNETLDNAVRRFKAKNKSKIEEYKHKTTYTSKHEIRRRKEYVANKKRTKGQNNGF